MSELYQSLSHSKWDCTYHVVFVPKRRRKAIFGQTRRHLGQIFHSLARQKECQILEGHLMLDHVHWTMYTCVSPFPPSTRWPRLLDFSKGKVRLRLPDWGAGNGISPGNTSGPEAMLSPRSDSNWSGSPIHPRAGERGWNRRAVLNPQERRALARRLDA